MQKPELSKGTQEHVHPLPIMISVLITCYGHLYFGWTLTFVTNFEGHGSPTELISLFLILIVQETGSPKNEQSNAEEETPFLQGAGSARVL